VPIRSLEYLKNIKFDEIYVGGRINDEIIDNLTINFGIPDKKIVTYSKNDIKLPKQDLLKKHKFIIKILKNINIASKERDFLYWLDFSSLLAVKRNNLFSEYSDTDIGVINNDHMEKIFLFLSDVKEKLNIKIDISYFSEKSNMANSGEISKIIIFNDVNIEDEEPICIDISRKTLFKNKFYQAYEDGKYFVSDKLFFDGQDLVDIFNIEVPIPLSVDKYLVSIYGENWKTPDLSWQAKNYSNLS
tara:strand:- start:39 stop:773 length:735 start_codon:yes stop_codon:yes gene_type:complete